MTIWLDWLHFIPDIHDRESAYFEGVICGQIEFDCEQQRWQARTGDGGDWHPMRSAAEARAYVVSMHRNGYPLIPRWSIDHSPRRRAA